MTLPRVWSEPLRLLRADSKTLIGSIVFGLAVSALTALGQAAWNYAAMVSAPSWFQGLGLPTPWIEVWKAPGTASLLSLEYYFHLWPFVQNWMFWAAIFIALSVVQRAVRGELPYALLPVYVLGLSWARIQLEFQMAISAMGSMITLARIDPFSYAQITSYFAMALLLFPVTVTVVSRLPFKRIFRLSILGFPIILIPPLLDNYVFREPVIYNFFGPEFYQGGVDLLKYVGVVSLGIKLEIALVAVSTFGYLLLRTRLILKSALAVLAVVLLFVSVSTPIVTFQLGLTLSQPQLFAGYLIITYVLAIVCFDLAEPAVGRGIRRRIRLRGIHFPAMTLFGAFLTHPDILVSGRPRDQGLVIAAVLVVVMVWQTATVFDDIYDRGHRHDISNYLSYGLLTGLLAALSAVPFGLFPWLLTLAAVYLAIDYPRIRRTHYLLSGFVIGLGSSFAFLFGCLAPMSGVTSQPIYVFAFLIFVLFSGGSFLKDVSNVEGDRQLGIDTLFTKFEVNRVLPIIATFVAAGCALPTIFLNSTLDVILLLAVAISAWLIIVGMKAKSYKPILVLYFLEGLWVFLRMFIIRTV